MTAHLFFFKKKQMTIPFVMAIVGSLLLLFIGILYKITYLFSSFKTEILDNTSNLLKGEDDKDEEDFKNPALEENIRKLMKRNGVRERDRSRSWSF
jgi:cell division protein FtsN